jgi:hypothetical protein
MSIALTSMQEHGTAPPAAPLQTGWHLITGRTAVQQTMHLPPAALQQERRAGMVCCVQGVCLP